LDPVRKTKLEGDGISLDNLSIVHLVAFYDSIECFCSFFSKKSDIVNQKNPKEFTPFHFALIGGSIHILSFLFSMYNLKDFTMPPRVDQKNNFSFITLAILSGSAQCVQLLLEFGALPNQDDLGFLSKQLLLYKDDSTEFKQPGRISFHTFIQVKEKSKKDKGETICMACHWYQDLVPILLKYGEDANVYYEFNSTGNRGSGSSTKTCPLRMANTNLSLFLQIIKSLPQNIDPPKEVRDHLTDFPIHWICAFQNKQLLQYVLEHKIVDVNAKSKNHASCIEKLLPAGSYKDEDFRRWIPDEFIAELDILFDKGFDINRKEGDKTPFIDYMDKNLPNSRVIKWFIDHGLNIITEIDSKIRKDKYFFFYFTKLLPDSYSYK